MNKFNELRTTKLGDIGEGFIPEFCKVKGGYPYQPSLDQSNPIDGLCLKHNKVNGIEVKTKVSMSHYPMTGMDTNDHNTYMNLGFNVCVVFVDYLLGKIYYQWISELDKHKQEMFGHKHVIYYPLSIMKEYRKLTPDEIKQLKANCSSNYN